MQRALAVAVAGALLLATGCSAAEGSADRDLPTATAATGSTSTAPTAGTHHRPRQLPKPTPLATTPAPPPTRAAPAFRWHSAPVSAESLGASWHSGCPVGPSALRALSMTYWGFDHLAHRGLLVVATSNVEATVAAFRAMYAGRFPIRQMQPVSVYGGSDDRSMAHDNTSAFNCRYAVSDGPKHWSMHAYGGAIDINPRENPYRLDGKVLPPAGAPYMDRSDVRPGMIVEGSVPVRAFTAVGWGWGGRWSSTPDYQHFSSTGG